jgi:hypothetical protein
VLNHNLGSLRATPSHLGEESPKVTNMNEVIGEVVRMHLLGVKGSLQKWLQSSLYGSRLRERRVKEGNGALDLKFDCISNVGVGNRRKEMRGSFYAPSLRYYHWGVKDPY